MPTASDRAKLAARLRAHDAPLPSAVVGFDGFIDEVIHLVDERQSLDAYTRVPSIAAFGDLVTRAAGRGGLREIVVTAVHPGGCAINLGDGLAALGVPVDAFATLGEPAHPAFSAVTGRFRTTHTWGREPGRTLAFEFADGKLMFSSVAQLAEFTPGKVDMLLADGAYAAACCEARLIGLTDWTLYPHMTEVWRRLLRDVYRQLNHHPSFFVDLVDPSSRSAADIHTMLSVLSGFRPIGPLTLGLNTNEAGNLARLLALPPLESRPESAPVLAQALRVRLAVSEVVIHHPKFAVVAGENGDATLAGPCCEQPCKTTGAGDRFNAGYALGQLLALAPAERLLCGCACAGFYVREAQSPTREDLAAFLGDNSWPA